MHLLKTYSTSLQLSHVNGRESIVCVAWGDADDLLPSYQVTFPSLLDVFVPDF